MKTAKRWTSGFYITWYLLGSVLLLFPVWEFVQLYRRNKGNKTALTMSQYMIQKAKEGSILYKTLILAFPVLIIGVGIWLIPHWEGFCINFKMFCEK